MKVTQVLGQWYDENCYVISQNDQALIVDPGATLENVKAALQGEKIVGILLTHGHFDHALYLDQCQKAFGCPVYASALAQKTLADHVLNQAESWELKNVQITPLPDDGQVKIGDFDVQYFSTPGHSPCGMCYLVQGSLFAGDTVFHAGIGRLDLVGCDKKAMTQSLQKLSALTFDTLYSGHGQSSDYARQKRNIAAYYRFLNR